MFNTARVLVFLVILLVAGCAGPLVQDTKPPTEAVEYTTERNPAVDGLIEQAGMAYQAGDYHGAIASAERGLRIDRREPALYLLLAQSYLELARPRQADEFARQGLRYTAPGTVLFDALEAVRAELNLLNGPTLTF
jgi:Tfp pilus assembly protein PilF